MAAAVATTSGVAPVAASSGTATAAAGTGGKSEFKSDFLLSDEAILALGVPSHDVEAYRRHHYRLQYAVERWYDNGLQAHTFRTELTPMTFDEANAVLWLQRQRVAQNRQKREKSAAEWKDKTPESEQKKHGEVLKSFERKLDEFATHFPAGFFMKLNTRSPKDAAIYQFREDELKQVLRRELTKLDDSKTRNDATETLVYVKAINEVMALKTGHDVIEMMIHSFRAHDDLSAAIRWGPALFDVQIVFREWNAEVPERPQYEFRGFVHNKQLNALTQYFNCCYFPELAANKDKIGKDIRTYFDSIKHLIPHQHFVIDFLMLSDRILVVELNPFHQGAGAGEFTWRADRELFMNGPFEFRIVTKDLPNVRSFINPHWVKFMDEECPRRDGSSPSSSSAKSSVKSTTSKSSPSSTPVLLRVALIVLFIALLTAFATRDPSLYRFQSPLTP